MDLGSLLGGLTDDAQGQNKDNTNQEPISDLLDALLGGAAPQNAQPPQPATAPQNSNDEVLGRVSGGQSHVRGHRSATQGGGMSGDGMPAGDIDLGGLLGGLLGGAASQGGMPQDGSGNPMSDILGGLLGGADNPAPNMSGQNADPMGGMLGGLLGGLLGGGSPNMGTTGGLNSALSPLADVLADKLGISREVAMTAIAIIVPVLMNKLASHAQQSGGLPPGSTSHQRGLTLTEREQHELVRQLSAQTGMDHRAASNTLTQAIHVLGAQ